MNKRVLALCILAVAAVLGTIAGCHGKSVLAPNGTCAAVTCASASQLCATAACASAPCTAGCVFHNPRDGACPTELPATIAPDRVTSCPHLCGFVVPRYVSTPSDATPTSGGTCYREVPDAPGCADRAPGCSGYNASCWSNTTGFEADEAAICGAGDTCSDGSYVLEDMAQANTCFDLRPPPDLSGVD